MWLRKFTKAALTRVAIKPLTLALSLFLFAASAYALPWDTDMYRQPSLPDGGVARAPAAGSVPVGYEPFTMSLEEAENNLKNPQAPNSSSLRRGGGLWKVHCAACHGLAGDGKGPVGAQIGAADLTAEIYKAKSDGRIFGVIMLGLRAMPRQGYKLSPQERWAIVNYVRLLQGKVHE